MIAPSSCLPAPIQPFVDFPAILRQHGFAVSPDQTIDYIAAIGLLGPRNMGDIHRAGLALLAIPPERFQDYDALFRAFFMGHAVSAPIPGEEEDEVEVHDPQGQQSQVELDEDENEAGAKAVSGEHLAHRLFSDLSHDAALTAFSRLAPRHLPRRLSYRRAPKRRGDRLDMRKTLREAVRRDGEVFTLPQTRRKTRQRRIVLLVDVSGSMQQRTQNLMQFAHALAQAADRFEAFTFGTRLTRITPALRLSDRDQALARIGGIVADFDGGTRIGDALTAFLSVPRFAGFARGAAVLVLSDGLERGDPAQMVTAVQRLSRLAWRLDWLTPLRNDTDYRPQTEALSAVLPWLNSLSGAANTASITHHVLNLTRSA
jgi:uncharacterized protein with von Willebrand factor type A (vWA) domain